MLVFSGMNPSDTTRWTRRSFLEILGGLGAASALLPFSWNSQGAEAPTANPIRHSLGTSRPRYRAVSWWVIFEDLAWPNQELMDKIRRRADQCVANGVSCCIIMGAHCRWDFMPLWDRLHDELHFIADELHQRNILLFEHHSSVVVERPRNRAEALELWKHNSHHLLFYPSVEEAARWEFNGSRLNDWRMIDVKTGQPVFLPTYDAEEFCMNNPEFSAAYVKYLKKLKADVPMDGLMSDDNIFYADWRACGCKYCRQRFQNEYGHDLPPTTDANFWGNRRSEAFKDWIAMRFRSSADFLIGVKNVFPEGFPLLTCCSTSDRQTAPAYGMSYQDFIKNTNHIMLEMTGSTPSLDGTWDNRIPSQLLHLAIARDYNAPCFGLGYGFFPDTAFFIWALNKFLGSDCWFSTDTGRIDGSPQLADDPELVGEGFRWEKAHPQLFTGQPDTDVAVLFSRGTRDYFGQVPADYCDDYSTSCLALTRAGITFQVVMDIPDFDWARCLVLSSVVCLSADEKAALKKFLDAGGSVVATGPNGFYDQRANPIAETWLETFGVAAELNEPVRPGGFPPYADFKMPVEIAQCRVPDSVRQKMRDGWLGISVGRGELLWRQERISKKGISDQVIKQLHIRNHVAVRIGSLPSPWRLRQYRDGDRLLIHALPGRVKVVPHPTFKWVYGGQPIVEKVQFTPLDGEITVEASTMWKEVVLHSPDLSEPRTGRSNTGKQWSVDLSGIARYFVLELLTYPSRAA